MENMTPTANTTDQHNTATEEAPMDAWAMASSLLIGLRETIRTTEAERAACSLAGKNLHFAPGVTQRVQMLQALMQAERDLWNDMHKIARSNALALPERTQ